MPAQRSFVEIVDGLPVIDIGALRHPITIQKLGPGSPPVFDAGGQKMVWNDFLRARAAIDQVRGTDVIRGGQITTQVFITIAIWWQAGILANMRVVKDASDPASSTYLIQSVENVLEINRVLLLNCIGIAGNE